MCAHLNSANFFDIRVECGPGKFTDYTDDTVVAITCLQSPSVFVNAAKDPMLLEDEEQMIKDKVSNTSQNAFVYRYAQIITNYA